MREGALSLSQILRPNFALMPHGSLYPSPILKWAIGANIAWVTGSGLVLLHQAPIRF